MIINHRRQKACSSAAARAHFHSGQSKGYSKAHVCRDGILAEANSCTRQWILKLVTILYLLMKKIETGCMVVLEIKPT